MFDLTDILLLSASAACAAAAVYTGVTHTWVAMAVCVAACLGFLAIWLRLWIPKYRLSKRFVFETRGIKFYSLPGAATPTVADVYVELATAERALREISPDRRRPVSLERVISCVSAHYALLPADLLAKKRTKSVAFARQVAMYLSRELTDCSLPVIGEAFGGRDHTTVLHACARIRDQLIRDQSLAALISQLAGKVHTA